MDHDSLETRIAKMERFLDAQAPGWKDQARWMRPNNSAPVREPLHVDEDQTRRDRIALGLEAPDVGYEQLMESMQPKSNSEQTLQPPANEEARRVAALAELAPFKGMDGYGTWDGTESADQLEGILITARARKAALDSAGQQS